MPTTNETKCFPRYSMGNQPNKAGQAALDDSMEPLRLSGQACYVNSFTGGENRNWKRQVRNGTNATTSASGSLVERTGLPMRAFVKGYVSGGTAVSQARSSSKFLEIGTLSFGGASSQQKLAVTNAARTKFSKKVEQALTQFSGGVFLAELRETLHMIRRPGQSLRKAVGQYLDGVHKNGRRMKRRPKRDRERWLSNSWLEYSFGWAPLLNDLDDASHYLERRQQALIQELVSVAASSSSRFVLDDVSDSNFSGVGGCAGRARVISEVTQVYAGAVSSRALGPGLMNASAMGLSSRSFAPTLWEVIPWSFLVDYFTNVGDVIQGWSNQHVHLSWGRDTLIEDRVKEFYDQRDLLGSLTTILERSFMPSTQKFRIKTFTRVPITSPPVPGFQFEIPGFGTKWLNMGALAASRRSISAIRLFD